MLTLEILSLIDATAYSRIMQYEIGVFCKLEEKEWFIKLSDNEKEGLITIRIYYIYAFSIRLFCFSIAKENR